MKVKDLLNLLLDVPDDLTQEEFENLDVLIPADAGEFNGVFVIPCVAETGVGELGIGEDEESEETQKSFVIVPHGFFDEKHGVPPELN